MTAVDFHLNTGAVALDCLPADESSAFAEHLAGCVSCQEELTGFVETVALLGSAAASPAPDSLRASVLAGIKVIPQLPPMVAPVAETSGRHRTAAGESAVVIPLRRPWYRRPQALLAAAVAAIVLATGTTILLSRSSGTGSTQASGCVQTAQDVQTFVPAKGTAGAVAYAASCRAATVSAAGLAALPAGKVYQLWILDRTGAARSVGVMKANTNGTVAPMDTAVKDGDTATAISVENAPGPAATPSKDIVWVANI